MTVHLVPWDTSRNLLSLTDELYEAAGTLDCVSKGDLVAVKLHVGELGNPYYVQPFFVHRLVQKISEAGGKPFLTDSNTYYLARRHDAVDHFQTAMANGFGFCQFISADGLRSESGRPVKTKGILKEIEVSGAIAEADAMIVVSHDKGHALTGFGGAIKNMGMGCTTRAGKLRQHRTVGLKIDEGKCVGCGLCRKVCEMSLPEIVGNKAKNVSKECMRCPVCMEACPKGAIKLLKKNNLGKALASASYGVLSTFGKNKVSFVSFAENITQFCDCVPGPGRVVMNDIGIFASDSPVSVDAAFLQRADYKIFDEAYDVDSWTEVRELKELGIPGELKPKIEEI
ncbi:MAG TPA: DUF362 domain-containing protein [Methanocella sp.]|uniref:DUF362 domain-containing protein n=1 Tax=Methanocella sp. TaxID=2052833 RepID=UPI002BD2A06A|nr:DUF362 domain-containing protein [Methanocella sp.]HTY91817.1 DUF362 domain-containing protein [Methanocella sp.]